MQGNVSKILTTFIVTTLFAAAALAAEDTDAEAVAATDNDAVEYNRNHARSANTAAVEDAIEAVRAANKLRLDKRLIDRTSMQVADSR